LNKTEYLGLSIDGAKGAIVHTQGDLYIYVALSIMAEFEGTSV
jgi:hypothetical protein